MNRLKQRSIVLPAGALASLVGGMVLLGWVLDIAALKSVLSGWVAMKPNTAVAFILAGLALLLSSFSLQPSTLVSRLSRFCALSAGLIGLLALCEYIFGWNPGFDQWLFPEQAGAVGTSHLGRMAPDTALCFLLFAAGWEFAQRQTSRTLVASMLAGVVMVTVALIEILSYFTPILRIAGWEGLTMMALPTAAMFAVLGAVIVQGPWLIFFGSRLTQFSRTVMKSAGLSVLLVVIFALYVQSVRQIDRTNKLRYQSYQLADELRQSGDDLTRMVRTYVATGNPVYKKYFQDILDIRDGRKPRPENYSRPYWDLVLEKSPAPRGSQSAIPLLELMRQAGFTRQELAKLAEAKANSDALTIPEFEAMKLVEATGSEVEANRARAIRILYNDNYHRAKVNVMRPIYDFFVLVDQRTLKEVHKAETSSLIYQYLFGLFGLGLIFMLWRTYLALSETLGGSLDEVKDHIARIGGGDFSSDITVKSSLKNSVLGWLSETQVLMIESEREREQAEAALMASEIRYRGLFDSAKDGILILEAETGMVLDVNPFLIGLLGFSYEQFLGKKVWELGFFKDIVANQDNFAELQRKEYIRYENLALETSDGRRIPVEFISNVSLVNQQKVIQCSIRDITERKQIEEAQLQSRRAALNMMRDAVAARDQSELLSQALQVSQASYQALFDEMQNGFAHSEIICDAQGRPINSRYLAVNPAFERITGRKAEDVVGKTILEVFPALESSWIETFGRVALTGKPARFEMSAAELGITFSVSAFRPAPNQYAVTFSDITDRKQAEERIKASLREKETLLKEIHHRVKNNLTVISSLLDLQSACLQDEKAREALQNSIERVKTMASIHTQLYQSQDLNRVDFGLFIRDLIGNISQSYGRAESPVEIHVDADEIRLGIDASIPCGLILNELVANALKHAFPEGKEGKINITMQSEENQLVLKVSDNGIGFSEPVDLTKTKSLGLELVNILVGQMNGKIEMHVDGGTTWTITLPLKEERKWRNG